MGLANYGVQRSFSGGELDPSLHARADTPRYTTGARELTNFFVRKAGGISNRCGTQYIATAGAPDSLVRIYPWSFTAAEQAVLIEAGDGYFRFFQGGVPLEVLESTVPAWSGSDAYTQGDLVIVSGVIYYAREDTSGTDPTDASAGEWYALPGTIYEIPTPYAAGAFNSPGPLRFSQSGAIITITHPGYAPMELQNTDTLGAGAPRWVLVPVDTDPSIDPPPTDTTMEGTPSQPPTGSDASHDPVPGIRTYTYKITSVAQVTYEESLPSDVIVVANSQAPTEAYPIVLAWTAVAGAVEYRIYVDPWGNGTFGYIGTATEQETFNDVGFAPDFTLTPPVQRNPFSGTYDKPEMSVIYQQRRVFGYTDNNPAGVEMSRTGFRSNFSMSSPIQDDDAISFTLASNDNNVVRHLIPLDNLVLLTESGPIVLFGDNDGAIRPDAINPKAQGEGGASRAPATTVGNSAVYVHRGGHIVLLFDLGGERGTSVIDLSSMAQHLFEARTIVKLVYQKDPHSIVWALGSDGVLLGLTLLPNENVWAWHKHTTGDGDVIEDICVLPEEEGDALYLVVQRTIGSDSTRYIERLALREGITADNLAARCIFADASVTYSGTPATSITGLDHLEGMVVSVVADGVVLSNGDPALEEYTVGSGAITLASAASVVHVGLPIRWPQFESLSLDIEGSNVRAKKKRVQGITAVVDRSVQGFWAGKTTATLTQQQRKTWEVAGAVVSQALEMTITTSWDDEGRFIIRHTEPLPLTILALLPFIEVGG